MRGRRSSRGGWRFACSDYCAYSAAEPAGETWGRVHILHPQSQRFHDAHAGGVQQTRHERILAVRNDEVRLRVRADGPGGRKVLRIDGAEFVGRFLQHVLPAGFKRIRHYGLLAAARKSTRLAKARAALAMPPPNPVAAQTAAQFMRRVARIEIERCPHCQGRWQLIELRSPIHGPLWPRAGRPATAARPQAP